MTRSHSLHLWPKVILSIYSPELTTQSRLSYLRPRVVYPISNSESFILFLTKSRSSCPWPRVIHLIHEFESSFSPLSIFVLLVTYLSLFTVIPPQVELFHPCHCSPVFWSYSRHALRQNLWSFFRSSVQFTSLHWLFVFQLTFPTLVIYTE